MLRVTFFFSLLICIGQSVIWETQDSYERRFQNVPDIRQTARKLMSYFLDRHGRLFKRELGIPHDTVLIVDASKSLSEQNFNRGLHALSQLVRRSRPNSKFAGISFSNRANITFDFVPVPKAIKGIGGMRYIGGRANTQDALNKARRKLFFKRHSGMRLDSYKRVFLLTDGQSDVKKWATLYKAFLIKILGVEIFVMAVGEDIPGIGELVSIASSSDTHLFRVGNMKQFEEVVRMIPIPSEKESERESAYNSIDSYNIFG